MNKPEANILGIIYIGGGSSWIEGTDETKVAFDCAKMCKMNWKHLFKFKRKHKFAVNIFDLSKLGSTGWYATQEGIFNHDTNETIPHKKTIWVIV